MRYVLASVLALSLTSFATFAQAQGGDESMNRLLESLQQVRTMMYDMAQSDKSMMAGVKNIDKTIAMVKKKMKAPRRALIGSPAEAGNSLPSPTFGRAFALAMFLLTNPAHWERPATYRSRAVG